MRHESVRHESVRHGRAAVVRGGGTADICWERRKEVMFRYTGSAGRTRVAAVAALLALCAAPAQGHVYIFESYRVGAAPPYDGSGWIAEVYLDLPEEAVATIVTAENYVGKTDPDFTFRTEWIDFPSGPDAYRFDTEYETMGDFFDDYITDVSDPAKLQEPFSNFLVRFRGYIRVTLADSVIDDVGLPVWVEIGSIGFDGYRTRIDDTIYRRLITDPQQPLAHENTINLALGLFPIEITMYNHYEPEPGASLYDKAGIELYSWHGGGLELPSGEILVHPTRGPATIVPPRVIYQAEDIRPIIKGDFDVDSDVDLYDFQWMQNCFTGPAVEEPFFLDLGCDALDFEDGSDVDLDDYAEFRDALSLPPPADGEQ